MTEPLDFIDTFDPADLERAEERSKKDVDVSTDQVRELLARRRKAYSAVFSKGHTEQEDIDFVLNDLARFSRAFSPTFDPRDGEHAEVLMHIKEGRREVFQRISDYARLSGDTLFIKYTDAQYK